MIYKKIRALLRLVRLCCTFYSEVFDRGEEYYMDYGITLKILRIFVAPSAVLISDTLQVQIHVFCLSNLVAFASFFFYKKYFLIIKKITFL